jgi:hypothetical protein
MGYFRLLSKASLTIRCATSTVNKASRERHTFGHFHGRERQEGRRANRIEANMNQKLILSGFASLVGCLELLLRELIEKK